MAIEYIDMTPTFEESARMCIVLLERGTLEGKATAREELLRYARELDRLKAATGTSFDAADTPTSEEASS